MDVKELVLQWFIFFDKTTESGGATFAKKSAVKNESKRITQINY